MILAALLLGAFTPGTIGDAAARYDTMKTEGYQTCFARLSGAPKSVAIDLAKGGHSAGQVCACVGERFATAYVAQPFDDKDLLDVGARKDGPVSDLFTQFFAACSK